MNSTKQAFNVRELLRGILLLPVASAIASRLSVYATLIVAARLLDGDQFGAYAVSLVFIGIFGALVTGGGDMWLNRFTSEPGAVGGQAPRLWPVYFTIVLAVSGALLALAFVFDVLNILPKQLDGLATLTIVTSILIGLGEALLALMRAGGEVRLFFTIRDIIAPIGALLLLIWQKPTTAFEALTIYTVVWATVFATLAARLLWRAPQMLPAIWPPKFAWAPIIRHTLGLIYGNLTSRISMYIDVLVLTFIVSSTTVGEYRVAAQFAIGFMVIQHFVFLGLPWQMRRLHHPTADSNGLATASERQRLLTILAAVGGLVMWLAARPLLGLLGERFLTATDIFHALLLIRFAGLLWGPQHEILVSNGLAVEDAHANTISVILWIVSFTLLLTYGSALYAAVNASIISSIGLHIYRVKLLKSHHLPEIYGHPLRELVPLAVSVAALALAQSL